MTVADTPPVPIPDSERSAAPDLARGAVLAFIALANVVSYLYGQPTGQGSRPVGGSSLDRTTDFIVSLVVDQRSYPMFAILFGYGMATMARRLAPTATRILIRRNLWLSAFGAIHATVLFSGDILGPYAVTGLLLTLVLYSSALIHRWWLGVSVTILTAFFAVAAIPSDVPAESSNYVMAAATRLVEWLVGTAAVGASTALLAPMIIGVWLSRAGWLDRPRAHVCGLRLVVLGGLLANLVGGLPFALVVAEVWQPPVALAVLLSGLHALSGVAAGCGYVALAGLTTAWLTDTRGPGMRGVPWVLASVGRASLTCYLLQSLLLAPLMAPWGFGVGDQLGTATAYLIAIGVYLVTVAIAVALALAGRRGPAEAVLRRLTYGRIPEPRRSL